MFPPDRESNRSAVKGDPLLNPQLEIEPIACTTREFQIHKHSIFDTNLWNLLFLMAGHNFIFLNDSKKEQKTVKFVMSHRPNISR